MMGQLLAPFFVFIALWNLFVFFVLRVLFRKPWLGALAYVMLFTGMFSLDMPSWYDGSAKVVWVSLTGLIVAANVLILLRFGLLAFAIGIGFGEVLEDLPITLDFSAWYSGQSLAVILVLLAIATYGCHTAMAGRSLFKDEMME